MIAIVQPDAQMAAAFEEIERLLRFAREQALFNDHPALDRNLRFLRLVRAARIARFPGMPPRVGAALRIAPPVELHCGRCRACDRTGCDAKGDRKLGYATDHQARSLRTQNVPGDAAITLALRRVIAHPPELAPMISFDETPEMPPALVRRMWLDTLPTAAREAVPVEDLITWPSERFPEKRTGEILIGFSRLLFHDGFRATFADVLERDYVMPDGELHGHPFRLESA